MIYLVFLLVAGGLLGVVLHELAHFVACLPWTIPGGVTFAYRRVRRIPVPFAIILWHESIEQPWDVFVSLAPAAWFIPIVFVDLPLFFMLAFAIAGFGTLSDVGNIIERRLVGKTSLDNDDLIHVVLLRFRSDFEV